MWFHGPSPRELKISSSLYLHMWFHGPSSGQGIFGGLIPYPGTGCRDDSSQSGGNDPQCVNNLLVCDGLRDCRNGADEEDCGELL